MKSGVLYQGDYGTYRLPQQEHLYRILHMYDVEMEYPSMSRAANAVVVARI